MIPASESLIQHLTGLPVWNHRCPKDLKAEPERRTRWCKCGQLRYNAEILIDELNGFTSNAVILVGQPAPIGRLQPGTVVLRHTDLTRHGVRAWVPCHDEHSVLLDPKQSGTLVRCHARGCSLVYSLVLDDEGDGGYQARWIVAPYRQLLDTTTRHGGQV